MWLIIASLFVAVGISAHKLRQNENCAEARELNEAAATLGLVQQPQSGWSGARVLAGTAQGFTVTWTLTPQSVGREIRIRIHDAQLTSSAELEDVTSGNGFVEQSFDDKYNDTSQLVPATRRLLVCVVKA